MDNGKTTIPCWNCIDVMRRFAQDTFYFYYICDSCKKERMVPRGDRPLLDLSAESHQPSKTDNDRGNDGKKE